jgi:hypothetical protein
MRLTNLHENCLIKIKTGFEVRLQPGEVRPVRIAMGYWRKVSQLSKEPVDIPCWNHWVR